MKTTAKFFKRMGALALIAVMCLGVTLFAAAENVEKAAIGEAKYYLVRNAGEATETETLIAPDSQTGVIRLKVDIYNYDESTALNAMLIAGLFSKADGVLKDIKTDRREGIAA